MTTEKWHTLPRTVYIGTFAYSKSPTEVARLEKTAVGVDEKGVIRFIIDGDTPQTEENSKAQSGWKEWNVVKTEGDGVSFFFPGFIGALAP